MVTPGDRYPSGETRFDEQCALIDTGKPEEAHRQLEVLLLAASTSADNGAINKLLGDCAFAEADLPLAIDYYAQAVTDYSGKARHEEPHHPGIAAAGLGLSLARMLSDPHYWPASVQIMSFHGFVNEALRDPSQNNHLISRLLLGLALFTGHLVPGQAGKGAILAQRLRYLDEAQEAHASNDWRQLLRIRQARLAALVAFANPGQADAAAVELHECLALTEEQDSGHVLIRDRAVIQLLRMDLGCISRDKTMHDDSRRVLEELALRNGLSSRARHGIRMQAELLTARRGLHW